MSDFQDNLFDKLQQDANVDPDDIYSAANSVKQADFSDEETVRNLVRQLAKIADKPISRAKEDNIVQSITNSSVPMDMQTLNQMFKK